jgi:hypothetical protein
MFSRILCAGMVVAVACSMVVVSGCEDNDSDAPTGTGSIRGEITLDAFTVLPGVLQGILVRLRGPVNAETVSDEDGMFEFLNLPAGEYVLYFYVNGEELAYPVTVAEDDAVILQHIRFNEDGTVTVFQSSGGGGDVNIAGDWTYVQDWTVIPGASIEQHLVLEQNGSSVSGTLNDATTVTGTVDGNDVTLEFVALPSVSLHWTSTGMVNSEEDSMGGTCSVEGEDVGTWTATRGWEGMTVIDPPSLTLEDPIGEQP